MYTAISQYQSKHYNTRLWPELLHVTECSTVNINKFHKISYKYWEKRFFNYTGAKESGKNICTIRSIPELYLLEKAEKSVDAKLLWALLVWMIPGKLKSFDKRLNQMKATQMVNSKIVWRKNKKQETILMIITQNIAY